MDIIKKFFTDLLPFKAKLQHFYAIYNDQKVGLHYPSFYACWDDQICSRKEILEEIRKAPFYCADNKLRRINGKPVRCLVLDGTKLPQEASVIFDFPLQTDSDSGKCVCDLSIIFNRGCQCGGA